MNEYSLDLWLFIEVFRYFLLIVWFLVYIVQSIYHIKLTLFNPWRLILFLFHFKHSTPILAFIFTSLKVKIIDCKVLFFLIYLPVMWLFCFLIRYFQLPAYWGIFSSKRFILKTPSLFTAVNPAVIFFESSKYWFRFPNLNSF